MSARRSCAVRLSSGVLWLLLLAKGAARPVEARPRIVAESRVLAIMLIVFKD